MSSSCFRNTGWVGIFLSIALGVFFLSAGSVTWLSNALSPDGDAGSTTISYMRILGLGIAAVVFVLGIFLATKSQWIARHIVTLVGEIRSGFRSCIQTLCQPDARVTFIQLLAITLLGAMARLVWIQSPIRLDEAISFMNFSRLGFLHTAATYHTNNHVLNSLLMALSAKIFGEAEWALRLPSFLASIACIPATFFLFRRITGNGGALLGAAFVALAPGLVEFGFLSRGYSLETFFFLLLLLALRDFVFRGRKLSLLAICLLPAGMMYTILSSIYPIGMAYLWGLFLAIQSKQTKAAFQLTLAFFVSGVLTLLLFAPLILVSGVSSITDNYYVQPQPLFVVLNRFPQSLLITWDGWWRGMSFWVPLLSIPFFCWGAIRLKARSPWWTALIVIPILILLQKVVPYPRTWLYLMPLYLGTAAAGLSHVSCSCNTGRRGMGIVAILFALAGAVWSPQNTAMDISGEASGWPDDRDVAHFLAREGLQWPDRVVSDAVYSRLHYYFRRLGLPHDSMDIPPDSETRRIFILHYPNGIQWRLNQSLGYSEDELPLVQPLAEFRLGTRLSVAYLPEPSSP